ncbi:ExeM/NucH family extracellular endonuclease [Leptolyngbya iicbica]|uniref:ExeM/NucH family extracellular endonuclease n=1 Tax=Leptolyngbya iicbica TaxID=3161580 RepID=UPI00068C49A7|nr:ExeM/NucH family extracellular endonuclease [Leptolyngbya sp. LK]
MATTLSAGDIAITGFNFDNPDELAFVLLVDIEAGTQITFTDNGWLAAGGFRANEGSFTWQATENLAAGTLVTPTVSGVAFSTSGDQLLAYQGDANSPTFIYALNSEGAGVWQADATSSNTSALPAGLLDGATAVALDEIDNAIYVGPTSGTKAELLAAISDRTNWTGSNSDRQIFSTSAFTVTDASDDSGVGGDDDETTGPVINEVLVSTTGADVEFIEIFGTPGTSLAGLSILNIEGGTGAGSIDNRFDLPDDAVIGDNGFYLVGNSLVATALGVMPDTEFPTNFFENSSSTIALVETATIAGDGVSGAEAVVDAVALQDSNSGTFFYGAPVLGPDGSFYPSAVTRSPDGGDFQIVDAFSPAGANTTPTAGTDNNGGDNSSGDAPLTLISAIQGNGAVSPLDGSPVTVEAVVVGDFQDGGAGTNGDFNGFFVQEEDTDADGDAATSEGLFIFDGNSPVVDVNVGDRVRVTGTVTEFFGETQLSGVTVEVLDNGDNSGLVTPATVTFPVANTVTNSDGALIADLEAYEGMLVTIPQELTVSDLFTLGRFGDIGLHADGRLETFTQVNAPSVSGFQAYQDLGVRNTVILDDGSTVQNPAVIPFEIPAEPGDIVGQLDANDDLNVGDTVTDLTGVVRFSRGSGGSGDEIYRINPVETVEFVNSNPRLTEAPEVGGNLKVASFNVLNFFTSLGDEGLTSGPEGLSPRGADNQFEFDRQVAKLVAALAAIEADVFGLVELENEFGDVNGDGEFAIGFLVDALNAAIPGANYQYVDPGMDYVGTDAIAVGFIYNANTVGIAEGTTVEVLSDSDLAGLGVDSGNSVFDGSGTSRNPIAVTFEELATGETFTAVNNHFKSKGSISPFGNNAGTGDGTGNNNEARLQAAIAIDAWLDTDPTGSGDNDFLILGDLNAYGMEDPIQYLLGEGYANMVAAFLSPGENSYSFGFPLDLDTSPQVQAFGALDYALANASLAAQVVDAAEWHINADEASAFDYNTNFKPDAQVDDLFGANPFRSSDHDPLIVGLNLSSPDDDNNDTDPDNGGNGGDDDNDDTDNGDTGTDNGSTGGEHDGTDDDDTDTDTDNGGTDNGGTDDGGEDVIAEILDLTGIDGNITANVSLQREAAFDNLLQFYVTDVRGAVNGINPGEAGYEDAVRHNLLAMPQLFVENLSTRNTTITLEGGFYYAPALIIDGDLHNLATIGDAAMGMTMIQRDGNVWTFEDWVDADFNDLEFAINSVESTAIAS